MRCDLPPRYRGAFCHLYAHVQAKMIAQRAPKTFGKWPAEAMPYPRKKVKSSGHHKSRHDRGGSKAHSSKGKE
ncbi:hypothetical protein BHM03_00046531 [Ensete ventricosum]|nr:hypothetical protein BHM03_00046531 [Ensete ventricosum]